jgi:hypothetical protein
LPENHGAVTVYWRCFWTVSESTRESDLLDVSQDPA